MGKKSIRLTFGTNSQGKCMNMTSYKFKNRNKKIRNIKKAATVKYELGIRGLMLSDIARDLDISNSAVYRAINDLSTIARVNEWVYQNLGLKNIE